VTVVREESSGRYVRATDDVVHRDVAGETFLVPIRGRLAELQELFVLNEVGSWVWQRLDEPRSVQELTADLVREFEVTDDQARNDITAFLHQLREAGLAEEVP